jgi:hypothetical protein
VKELSFDEFWQLLAAKGYQYGFDAADNAYMGYKFALELQKHERAAQVVHTDEIDEDLKKEIVSAWVKAAKNQKIQLLSDMEGPVEEREQGLLVARTRQFRDDCFYTNLKKEFGIIKPRYLALHSIGVYDVYNMESRKAEQRVWIRFGYIV